MVVLTADFAVWLSDRGICRMAALADESALTLLLNPP